MESHLAFFNASIIRRQPSQVIGDVSSPAWKNYRPGTLGQQLKITP
jgi:hypothetical protein